MLKRGPLFREQRRTGVIRFSGLDSLGQEPLEKKKKKKKKVKKRPLSLMNNNEQCHLVAICVCLEAAGRGLPA